MAGWLVGLLCACSAALDTAAVRLYTHISEWHEDNLHPLNMRIN